MPSILVADDNTNIQKMVSLAFEDRGITVIAVGNGEAAVRRIPDMNPDLVLADIFMPVRNGYEVCEFVKKDQRFSHVPVILLVGAFDPLDEKEARRVGADGVLKKPFVPPDPLIAMVISALEKNPRVVAELAKAKASLEPHAMPDAAAPLEIQSVPKPEPKPLPDFPEPTPEEAAIVYGFGKGVRAIDDDEQEAAKKGPMPIGRKDDDDDDDFENAATTSDWRRNAMDFEISDEDASRPAFSVDELEPAQFFPSEFNKEKSAAKAVAKDEPAVAAKAESKVEAPVAAAHEVLPNIPPEIADEVDVRAMEPAEEPMELAPVELPKGSPVTSAASSPSVEQYAPVIPPPAAHEHEAKPSLASRMRHWMDALVSSPATQAEETHQEPKPGGDWMDSLTASAPAHVMADKPAEAPVQKAADVTAEEPTKVTMIDSAKVAAVEPEIKHESFEPPQRAALEIVKPAEEAFFAEESAHEEPAAVESAKIAAAEPVAEASSFEAPSSAFEMPSIEPGVVEEPQAEAAPVEAVSPVIEIGRVAGHVEESADYDIAPVEMDEQETPQAVEVAPEPSPEIWERVEETTPSERDPDLVVSEAVHVTPEPLLIDEEPEQAPAHGGYGDRHEEAAVAGTFEIAAAPEPVAEEAAEPETPSPEPAFEFAAAEEAVAERAEERVPTGPPPNREALAEIPFLNPPVGFDPNVRSAQPAAADATTVDAVVEKLLEKLQPQLHELLSQGVLKPLVENLLQQEASKKQK